MEKKKVFRKCWKASWPSIKPKFSRLFSAFWAYFDLFGLLKWAFWTYFATMGALWKYIYFLCCKLTWITLIQKKNLDHCSNEIWKFICCISDLYLFFHLFFHRFTIIHNKIINENDKFFAHITQFIGSGNYQLFSKSSLNPKLTKHASCHSIKRSVLASNDWWQSITNINIISATVAEILSANDKISSLLFFGRWWFFRKN